MIIKANVIGWNEKLVHFMQEAGYVICLGHGRSQHFVKYIGMYFNEMKRSMTTKNLC